MPRPKWMLAVALAAGSALVSGQEPLPPPIAPPHVPTSSFGEYRVGHYHGGLDFSTGGREGVPVLAPRRGWVWRVRASGAGYGRAIYFRLEDGRTLVFAHLSRFQTGIDAKVVSEQDRLGNYEVDLRFDEGELAYAERETLGWSGQSGAGPPHLHAEIRTGSEAAIAINPWLHGWAPPDTVAPVLGRLRVEPAEPGVLVNGGLAPAMLPLGPGGTVLAPLRITGPVRLWVETWDPAGSARLAPYRVTAAVDGRTIAEVAFDQADWNWAREVGWTFDAAAARARDERWIRLEAAPGGRQSVARSESGWVGDLDPGPHTLVLESVDASGNRSRAARTVVVEPFAVPAAGVVVSSRRGSFTSRGAYLEAFVPGADPQRFEVRAVRPGGDEAGLLPLRIPARGGALLQWGRPDPAEPGLWSFFAGDSLIGRAVWVPGAGSAFSFEAMLPWRLRAKRIEAEVSGFRLALSADVAYGPLWIALRVDAAPGPAGPELRLLTPVIELEPWAAPLRKDLSVAGETPVGRGRGGIVLVRRDEDGFRFLGADTTGAGVAGSAGSLEAVAMARDGTAPRVTIEASGGSRRPRLAAFVRDDGAGVSGSDLIMRLDGKRLVAEWDPDAGRLLGYPRGPVPPGSHELTVEAVDRAGNRARARKSFVVP